MLDYCIIAFLLILLCFFSSSETVLTAVSKPYIKKLALDGDRKAIQFDRLHSQSDRLLGAILLGNTLIQIVVSSIATTIALERFGESGVWWETSILTIVILVFCEIIPKTIMLYNANKGALLLVSPMRLLSWAFGIPMILVQRFIKLIMRSLGLKFDNELDIEETRAELRGAIEIHTAEQQERSEGKMLRSILDLGDVAVSEVMTHRGNLLTIDSDLSPEVILDYVTKSSFSRIPLWQGSPDNIVGILHSKALLRSLRDCKNAIDKLNIRKIMSPPWFIPETTNLLDQLHEFKVRREHFALVVDEYGAILGVVTLEDIIEEIVGDIIDEHEIHVTGVWRQADGSLLVNGNVTIRDLNREFDWRLPDEEAATIAGLLLHESRMIPEEGQVFRFYGFRFEVMNRVKNHISQIKLTPMSVNRE